MRIFTATITLFLSAVIHLSSTYQLHPVIGEPAAEIALPDPNGKILKLSELKGKVVLIDFWASWCRTCRVENINIRNAHRKYNKHQFKAGNGFEVYSVSLDIDSVVWKKAIRNDKLSWKYHVSDFLKWDSPVVENYHFKFLPHNILINGKGIVIAKGLFGNKLDEFLASMPLE